MKKRLFALSLLAATLTSCERTYNCSAIGDSEFSHYFGALSDYGSHLGFTTASGDSLGFPLVPSFSEPYTCTSRGNALNKECNCEGHKTLRDDLPQSAIHDFQLRFTSYGTEVGSRGIRVQLSVDSLAAGFNLSERDEDVDNRIESNDSELSYTNDTTINGRFYERVLVVTDLRNTPAGGFLLSRNQGLIGFRDGTGREWYRVF